MHTKVREGGTDLFCPQVVKQCVQVLVGVSKEQVFSPAEAAQLKATATAVRNMVSKLDSGLIKVPCTCMLVMYVCIDMAC